MRIFTSLLFFAVLPGLVACSDQATPGKTDLRPNILLIIADDLGYSDLGVFGGEISTPNLDALAGAGKMLTNFHVAPTCSPTRAMLMSGADAHRAGLGTMNGLWSEEQKGKPGYEGFLNKDIVTFVRLLKEAGYHTYMSGKWQLGYEDGYYPLDRGFEEAFWLKFGGASHFSDMRGITEYGEVAY
ncbi:MAG: sulfatase-like hydrolase/transferase, partial [Gammaproteobacteria bacterium]|nr:sulfatase-like hydrolase/transferase [Gammaproteobacteria bacterium]